MAKKPIQQMSIEELEQAASLIREQRESLRLTLAEVRARLDALLEERRENEPPRSGPVHRIGS